MRVLVTGASGLVGSHVAAALAAEGHTVRCLARDHGRLKTALAPFSIAYEVATGDMTDTLAVSKAVDGCDSLVHAAAVVGVHRATADGTDTNLLGSQIVMSAAAEAGADPIVYTSSVSAYLPTEESLLTADSPLSEASTPYATSKRSVEVWVRTRQNLGDPIVTFVLGAVYGPPSPHPESSYAGILGAMGRRMMVAPPSGVGVVDVRDLAVLIARSTESAAGPRRFFAGGNFLTWRTWAETLAEAAGTEIAIEELSTQDLITLGRDLDALRAAGTAVPGSLSEEAAVIMSSGRPTDDSETLAAFGVAYRPAVETFADTISHLRYVGLLPPHGE